MGVIVSLYFGLARSGVVPAVAKSLARHSGVVHDDGRAARSQWRK